MTVKKFRFSPSYKFPVHTLKYSKRENVYVNNHNTSISESCLLYSEQTHNVPVCSLNPFLFARFKLQSGFPD